MKLNKNKKKYVYPSEAIEVFNKATNHVKYSLSFIKKSIFGDILEVGPGDGNFTRYYLDHKIKSLILSEKDNKNLIILNQKFKKNKKITITNQSIEKIKKTFDTILYFHVLEHIKNDKLEINRATKKLKKNGKLIIISPAHQKMYSNLDKFVGHYRRYDLNFFKQKFNQLKIIESRFLDSAGYLLYYLNNVFFKQETYPSKIKIFLWDKIFTPITIILDFILRYKFGKCILVVYKKY